MIPKEEGKVGRISRPCGAVALLLMTTCIMTSCFPLDTQAQRGSARRYKAPRPVPFSQSWRGERPGYYIYSGFVRTSSRIPKARNSMCRLDVLLDGPPELPYEILGIVSAEKIGPALVGLRGGEEQAVGWLKAKACRIGASAIYDIDTKSQWFSFRERLVRSIRGTAVAAIYLRSAPAKASASVEPVPGDSNEQWDQLSDDDEPVEQGQEQEPSNSRDDQTFTPWLD